MQKVIDQSLKVQKDLFSWQMEQVKLMESHTVQLLDLNRKTLELGVKTLSSFGQVVADGFEKNED